MRRCRGWFLFRLRAPRRFLSGDLIENSPYHLFMEQDQFCKILCQVTLKAHEVAALKAEETARLAAARKQSDAEAAERGELVEATKP